MCIYIYTYIFTYAYLKMYSYIYSYILYGSSIDTAHGEQYKYTYIFIHNTHTHIHIYIHMNICIYIMAPQSTRRTESIGTGAWTSSLEKHMGEEGRVNIPKATRVNLQSRCSRLKGALQLLMSRYGNIRFAQVPERV